jgi:hypothetical protein
MTLTHHAPLPLPLRCAWQTNVDSHSVQAVANLNRGLTWQEEGPNGDCARPAAAHDAPKPC